MRYTIWVNTICTVGKDPQCYLRIPALTRIWLRRSHGGTWPVIMASRIATPSGPSRGIGTPFISRTSSSLTQDFFSQSTTLTPGPSIDSTVDWISWSSIPKNVRLFLVFVIFFIIIDTSCENRILNNLYYFIHIYCALRSKLYLKSKLNIFFNSIISRECSKDLMCVTQ